MTFLTLRLSTQLALAATTATLAGSLLALPARAQMGSDATPARAVATPLSAGLPATPQPRSVASPLLAGGAGLALKASNTLRVSAVGATTTVHAAGSVLLLADGIVADARTAQVLPPAPGFQYER